MNTNDDHEMPAQFHPIFEPGLMLPDDWAENAQKAADLINRRLDRLEKALGLDPLI